MVWNYKKLEEEYNKINKKLDDVIVMCDEYNWHDLISMRFALDKIKKEIIKIRGNNK